ncbi:hypothetical protein FACS1894199_18270 [Bacteroidia bacterium]|nr:hypothetical protein FACS1894199_18270 [Bacteroidia bacterium]
MSATVRAYYDGTVFVPMNPLSLQTGKVFNLSVLPDDTLSTSNAKKALAFRQITANLHKLEKEEPLPSAFDEILSHRLHFNANIEV